MKPPGKSSVFELKQRREQRTSTGSGLFSFLGSGFAQIFVSGDIKRQKTLLPVDVRRLKTPFLKLPCLTGVGTKRITLTAESW